jgi:hypothetical protein
MRKNIAGFPQLQPQTEIKRSGSRSGRRGRRGAF